VWKKAEVRGWRFGVRRSLRKGLTILNEGDLPLSIGHAHTVFEGAVTVRGWLGLGAGV
jgi:hypothetical protein